VWRGRCDGSSSVFKERIGGDDGVFCHFVSGVEERVRVPFVGVDLIVSEEVKVLVTEGSGVSGTQELMDFCEIDGRGVMTGGEDRVASEGGGSGMGCEEVG